MKKRFYFILSLCAFLSVGIMGCSDDVSGEFGINDGVVQKGDGSGLVADSLHFIQDIYVPYIPIAFDDAPDWMKSVIDACDGRRGVNITVIRGYWNGQYVYNIHSALMSILIGRFYDQDGNPIDVDKDFDLDSLIYKTEDWTCIINYQYC